jgi:hypothetical protein
VSNITVTWKIKAQKIITYEKLDKNGSQGAEK